MEERLAWPDANTIEGISGHQRWKVAEALRGTISILGGSPGCGKTYVAAALIKAIVAEIGFDHIAVCAPTGKAAVRVTEAMESYGLPLRARTIHSLLGVTSNSKNGGWGFEHNEFCPLQYKFIIVDESSMIDTDLMASLLAARPKGCHMLFVGDVNQLPPVGHGAPLRDMIAAGLPYGELREIRRNSGAIVEACAAIRDGKPFRTCETVDIENGENFKVAEVAKPEQQIETMLRAVRRASEINFDPVWDCQVLVPVNDKSPLARKALNEILQRELNHNPGVSGSPFRIGDKIVNTKNGWFRPFQDANDGDDDGEPPQTNDRGEVYVANGELAEVISVAEKLTVAKLSNPTRIVNIPRGKAADDDDKGSGGSDEADSKAPATGCTWDLGYALSCHKSQGSEWPIVVVMVDDYPGARMVASREWTYTAISRAKKLCLAIGKLATLQASCRKVALGKRKTFLRELILRERAKVEAAKQQTPELVETA